MCHKKFGFRGGLIMPTLRTLPHNLKYRALKYYRRRHNLRVTGTPQEIWAGALDDELCYWREWLATEGNSNGYPRDYQFRLNPESEIQESITRHLSGIGPRVRMLDVGAGPLTHIGKRWRGHEFTLTAVDALADKYDVLLEELDITPPVRTRLCDAENLSKTFPESSFDVAFAGNSLDHCYDPLRAIRQLIAVVRPGGVVLLEHFANEAEHEAYSGMHQWNFDYVDGCCLLWRPGIKWQLGKEFSGQATVAGTKADGRVVFAMSKLDSRLVGAPGNA
jgi:SAM-dependent methyltransferase